MRISYNWLKDYVDIKMSAQKLAEFLTMAGLSVDSIEEKTGDSILEVEITSNRPDLLSYIGIAREVAAITGRKLKVPSFVLRTSYIIKQRAMVSVKVEEKKLCPRYTARIIRNVKVGEPPEWLKKKIESIGLRSVNNIVDITNFCLFETGEPMHAFDLKNLSGGSIIVRRAKGGERITAIDGTERGLDDSMLVIADSRIPVAIAGVMGSLKTEVGMATKDILLEAAYFDPISVRRTSRMLALPTESSYRFERKVNIENIAAASDRATGLILEIAGGEAGEFIDIGRTKIDKKVIGLRSGRLNKILGVGISLAKAKNMLTSLGLKAKSYSKNMLKLEIPPFRNDLQDEIDIIEEVARIYGYGNIPETLPGVVEKGERLPSEVALDDRIRDTLAGLGLCEIITYGLLSRNILASAKVGDADAVAIKNPLSAEQEIMRPSAIPGMLGAIRYNINRKNRDLRFFELGKVYFNEGNGAFTEKRNLAIGLTGRIHGGWLDKSRDISLFDLKGTVEALFSGLGVDGFSLREAENSAFSQAACAAIEIKGEPAGIIGEVDPKVLSNFDIKDKVYAAEIDCGELIKFISLKKYFRELPRYPSVLRDISIVVDSGVLNGDIVSLIKENGGALLKEAVLMDRYHGGQIPAGGIGLTYRLEYQDIKRTLEDKDIQDAHTRIIGALETRLGARLR